MKLKKYLKKQLQKALDHQEEHPLSGSANRAVKEASRALDEYIKVSSSKNTKEFNYATCDSLESMGWLNRGD